MNTFFDETWREEGDMQAMAVMTLRDVFAAKAMQGFASDPKAEWSDGTAGMARSAYRWADFMLRERMKP